jgi:predicted GNAT superfamily acetyltransferase
VIVIRECRGLDELQACVDLQIEVWGYCDGDVIPRRVFLVAQKIGGQAIGAFDTNLPGAGPEGDASSMIGFAFGLPGVKTGSGMPESYLHSHMLAVRDGYRNQRIGARLKLAQREDALGRGIRRIEWTFDPLEIKNAFLNIHKLGAVVRRYEADFYGVSSSRLQGGLPTDRLVAEWWLDSPRVLRAIDGAARQELAAGFTRTEDPAEPNGPGARSDTYPEAIEEIQVPAAIYAWKAEEENRPLALEVQSRNRQRFQELFAQGLTVVGFKRDEEGNGIYRLERWTEPGR